MTISVVPEKALDDWDLVVYDGEKPLAFANSTFYMDYVQLFPFEQVGCVACGLGWQCVVGHLRLLLRSRRKR